MNIYSEHIEPLLFRSFYVWGFFWGTYHILSLILDSKYKTNTKLNKSDIYKVLFRNMKYTAVAQVAIFGLIPQGMLNPQYMIWRFLISVMITEIVFFYTHKLLHRRSLYKYHSVHHRFIEPCASSAMYCHPIEAVFSNQLAVTIGPVILGMSLNEMVVWSILSAINTTKAHSGLNFSCFNSRYHDLHHSKRNVNFGFLYLLDILHGTCDLS